MDLYERIAMCVHESDRCCISVADDPSFAYTIGNALVGLPEMIVFGLHPRDATPLLNTWSKMMVQRAAAFRHCERIDVGGAFPCLAMVCDVPGVRAFFTIQAGQFLGREDYDVMQILVPDKAGRFPTDADCDPKYRAVPVLSLRGALH